MTGRDAVKRTLTSTQGMLASYLADLSDADLLVRPVPGANHIAWQLGHLINTEGSMGEHLPQVKYPVLPPGWAAQHSKETAQVDPPKGFASKAEYLRLFNRVRDTTVAALDKLTDADLDKAVTGEMANWAPSLGALLLLNADHTMMHAGQFTVVRRKLGKPHIF